MKHITNSILVGVFLCSICSRADTDLDRLIAELEPQVHQPSAVDTELDRLLEELESQEDQPSSAEPQSGRLLEEQDPQVHQPPPAEFGPYFFGYEMEPAMDYGGRVITSLHCGLSDLGALGVRRFSSHWSWLSVLYELPLSVYAPVIQHEIFGHGGRAREFGLHATYGLTWSGGYAAIEGEPKSIEDVTYMVVGGMESSGIMARRIQLDLCQEGGTPASSVPLMAFAKMDLSNYANLITDPWDDEVAFTSEYEDGYDPVNYLVARQGQRQGASVTDIWNRTTYTIDFTEPELHDTYDQMLSAAQWDIMDPMIWGSVFLYVKEHLVQGKRTTSAPALPLGKKMALTLGTRAAMAPDSITRFADLYLIVNELGIFSVYGRDLKSASDTTFGFGASAQRLQLGDGLKFNLSGDFWENPAGKEQLSDENYGWNLTAESELSVYDPVWLVLKLGGKSDGFFQAPHRGLVYMAVPVCC